MLKRYNCPLPLLRLWHSLQPWAWASCSTPNLAACSVMVYDKDTKCAHLQSIKSDPPSPIPAAPSCTYRCECAAAWACVAFAACWWWHDAPVCHHHHVLAAELLLKLTNQPLLDLVEVLQQAEGNLKKKGQGVQQQRGVSQTIQLINQYVGQLAAEFLPRQRHPTAVQGHCAGLHHLPRLLALRDIQASPPLPPATIKQSLHSQPTRTASCSCISSASLPAAAGLLAAVGRETATAIAAAPVLLLLGCCSVLEALPLQGQRASRSTSSAMQSIKRYRCLQLQLR